MAPRMGTTDVTALPRLLVVDDDPTILRLLVTILGGSYALGTARSGAEALAAVAEGAVFDGAILDVVMANMDGFELAEQLRAPGPMAELPIVMLTALDNAEHRRRALEVGANAFITKPFEPELLEATLSMHIPRVSLFP
ncbi:hypothetical protein BH23ACT9_BH23ACT9_08900 [soil metagenome]